MYVNEFTLKNKFIFIKWWFHMTWPIINKKKFNVGVLIYYLLLNNL